MTALRIALKDLRLLARDRAALLFTVLVPLMVISIVAGTLGGSGAGTVVLPVVNRDEGPVATALLEALREHVEVREVDQATAERWVGRDGAAAAALVLPERLSKQYLGGRPSTLMLLTDPAKGTELSAIRAYLLLADREAASLADPLSEELLVVEERNLTGTRLTISSFEQNVPGFALMFVFMGVLFGVAFGLRDERDWGTATRLAIAPVSRATLFGGKLLARFVVGVVQMCILFGFGHLVFGVSLGPSLWAFLGATVVIVFALVGVSMLGAVFARTREQIIPLGLTVVMILCAIGGCWWPLFMEPPWLQRIAHATPTMWAMRAIDDLVLRNRGLTEMTLPLLILVAYGSACLAAGVRWYRLHG